MFYVVVFSFKSVGVKFWFDVAEAVSVSLDMCDKKVI
jgi:hypothetical protein